MCFLRKILVFLVRLYQKTFSLLVGNCCCFYPSCSNYMIVALERYGAIKGLYLGCKRLIRCHPGAICQVDHVP